MRMRKLDLELNRLLSIIAAAVLFAMMLLTFVDVVLRYIFNAPLRGSFEVTELMMVVLIFAGLPLVSRRDEHVVMDFLDHLMPPLVLRAVRRIVHAVCGAVLAGVGWLILQKAAKMLAYGDTSSALHIALAPFVYLMAILIFVTALIHLFLAFAAPGRLD
jgi:TRAP-type C4-dicarboxylate transport system permease small subunit